MTDATHAAFALALHRKLPTGNRCWSPFPVAAALCGATGVAGEDTGVAVARVLGSDVERTAKLLAIAAGEDAVTSTGGSCWTRTRTSRSWPSTTAPPACCCSWPR
ncbi:hypothetical protein [Saccharothrix sp. NRRL B-16314]|uniref:hypothetical protein n=1 Tax=Saccharothrix sp. NRRL B-16314 TaxID=1463825 RepID=UPI000ABB5CB7|nr:hypothetical protein [Saccharothrix sp. NRRL B-16314]